MRDNAVRSSLLLLLNIVLVASCAPTIPSTPTPTIPPPVTLTPAAEPAFVAGCTTDDLENWGEQTDFLLRDFIAVLNQAENQDPAQVRITIQRIAELRDALLAVPAPEACAAEAQHLAATLINTATDTLQRYANGEDADLSAMQDTVNNTLGSIQELQNALDEQLREQFQAEQTRTAPTG